MRTDSVNVRGLYHRKNPETAERYESNCVIQQAVDAINAAVPGTPPHDSVDTVKIGDPAQLEAAAYQRESPHRRSTRPAIDSHLRIDQEFKCKGMHAAYNPEDQG